MMLLLMTANVVSIASIDRERLQLPNLTLHSLPSTNFDNILRNPSDFVKEVLSKPIHVLGKKPLDIPAATEALLLFQKVMESDEGLREMQFWLCSGTALGFVRNGTFIAWVGTLKLWIHCWTNPSGL